MPVAADPAELVPPTYIDALRRTRSVSARARSAVLEAIGAPSDPEVVAIAPRGSALLQPGELTLEDGTSIGHVEAVPRDVPFGYHTLATPGDRIQHLITGPGRCHLPADLREWGWSIQLPTTRSRRSWGLGDLGDLRDLGAWSASVGAGFMIVSPLNAPNPGPDPDPSPYFPSTRRWRNPIHLRIEDVPGAPGSDDHASRGLAHNSDAVVDRRPILALKARALEAAWKAGAFDPAAFAAWRAAQGPGLERWAAYNVLAREHGSDWRRWPEPIRHPGAPDVRRAAAANADAIGFHAWVQWCLDLQLRAASGSLRRIADMPVASDPGGFDAWEWQGELAVGVTIGVPPDRFNLAGQNWGMPAFSPHRLREAAYRPLIETIRAQLLHAGGLRLDHVLGLFRLWCIPGGFPPTDGAYLRQRTDEMLEIVALESERASAVIIGEDLGTVPAGVRPELRRRRVLSTRLAYFERVPPARYPSRTLAAVTTHDLPTVAGLWTGADLADQAASGVPPDPLESARLRARLANAAGVGPDVSADVVRVAIHGALSSSPAALVAATLEDALGVAARPNLPGTLRAQRANWSRALPVAVEGLGSDRRVRSVVAAMRRR
ncbi:MAG TPA: 4-alpha-glucanotransferase [Candidatus Limnocylindria bacterium]